MLREQYDVLIFDVDKTIAPNNEAIPDAMIETLARLNATNHIALVTARGLEDHLQPFVEQFAAQARSHHNQLYLFPTTATCGYVFRSETNSLQSLYNFANSDAAFLSYQQDFHEYFSKHDINIIRDVIYDENEVARQVQIDKKGRCTPHQEQISQINLFFSHRILRQQYMAELDRRQIHYVPHARNVLHILPKHQQQQINKAYALSYLSEQGNSRFLIFADGFYHNPATGSIGNDVSFLDHDPAQATCLNVGRDLPKYAPNVYHFTDVDAKYEWQLTLSSLQKVLDGAKSIEELGFKPMEG